MKYNRIHIPYVEREKNYTKLGRQTVRERNERETSSPVGFWLIRLITSALLVNEIGALQMKDSRVE